MTFLASLLTRHVKDVCTRQIKKIEPNGRKQKVLNYPNERKYGCLVLQR